MVISSIFLNYCGPRLNKFLEEQSEMGLCWLNTSRCPLLLITALLALESVQFSQTNVISLFKKIYSRGRSFNSLSLFLFQIFCTRAALSL